MILHIDFDSFFASAERARYPEYAAVPLAVCGGEIGHEMVLAATYCAKARGVFTTQRLYEARACCENLVCLRADLPYYRRLSQRAKQFFEHEIPVVEQYSIDEFFGDLTGWVKECAALEFAQNLQRKVRAELGLDASIGISRSKWSAKLLTTLAKPASVRVAADIIPVLANVPIEKFAGIGKVLSRKLKAHGIATLDAALLHPELFVSAHERKILRRIQGIDGEKVLPNAAPKSIGASKSFRARKNLAELEAIAYELANELATRVLAAGLNPSTLRTNFAASECEKSASVPLRVPFDYAQVRKIARALAQQAYLAGKVYHLGLSACDFSAEAADLFSAANGSKRDKLNALLRNYPNLLGKI